jgi:16S rRNA (guanine527-N7)-methyltransferase
MFHVKHPDARDPGGVEEPVPVGTSASAGVPTEPRVLPEVEEADPIGEPPAAAAAVFGERLGLARRYAAHLVGSGVEWGLVGPREAPRIWERHLLNCAVVAELLPDGARTVDVGSGAGLPGIPLALARPDLSVVLVEPLARRVDWLRRVVEDLGLPVQVVRGRAEEPGVRARWEGADVVTARAVAPLHRLAGWALPLVRPGGSLLALKGATAADEVTRDAAAVRRLGGSTPRVVHCGADLVSPPSTVVVVERSRGVGRRPARPRRWREERT